MREWQLQVDSGDSVFADPDAIKEGLVEGPPDFVGGVEVRLLAVGNECESVFEVAFDVLEAQGAGVKDALRCFLFAGDPGLLFFEEFDGDGIGVVGLQQLLALCLQPLQPTSLTLYLTAVQVHRDLDVTSDMSSDLVDALRGVRTRGCSVRHGSFHVIADTGTAAPVAVAHALQPVSSLGHSRRKATPWRKRSLATNGTSSSG
ncbi:MAG TPA: hypothetical protein VLG28_02000 [Acidimicrobiia bacterium]|nr:hypothetical protein [Acidimicrobiia bacterium]